MNLYKPDLQVITTEKEVKLALPPPLHPEQLSSASRTLGVDDSVLKGYTYNSTYGNSTTPSRQSVEEEATTIVPPLVSSHNNRTVDGSDSVEILPPFSPSLSDISHNDNEASVEDTSDNHDNRTVEGGDSIEILPPLSPSPSNISANEGSVLEDTNDIKQHELAAMETELIDISEEDAEWKRSRHQHFDSWYENGKLKPNVDANGTVLDFLIAGFPKCGTTTLEANLGYYAPMPIADICTPVHQTVYYSYKNWPAQYDKNNTKIYRGSKCPKLLESGDVRAVSTSLPKTKLILGIRHPVLWFQVRYNILQRIRRLTP